MRTFRSAKSAVRLNCESLEDRLTPAVAYALSGTNLLAFDTANPTVVTTTAIDTAALGTGETLVGIDFRPQNGQLYALGVNETLDNATLYVLSTRPATAGGPLRLSIVGNPMAGVAPVAGQISFPTIDLPAPSVGYGFDFNPSADRIRVTTGNGLNFRVNPNNGEEVDAIAGGVSDPDEMINGGTPAQAGADGSAYTNNFANTTPVAGPFPTTLYHIDATTGNLFIQNPPNTGDAANVLPITVGGNPLTFTDVNGFDIPFGISVTNANDPATGQAFAVLTVGTQQRLYGIELSNGNATLIGTIGDGTAAVQGFAVENDYGGLPVVALSAGGTNLVRLNTFVPAGGSNVVPVGTLTMGEVLVGIDFRPSTGQLYGLGVNTALDTATLYVIDPQNGAVTAVGTPGQISFVGTDFPLATVGYGLDFNPTSAGGTGAVRVVTGDGLNFRIDPISGNELDGDAGTAGNQPDTAVTGLPTGATGVTATAYTNSNGGATTTTQYTLDAFSNSLFIQGAVAPPGPNGGVQSGQLPITVNGTALDFTEINGFSIPGAVRVTTSGTAANGLGFAILTVGTMTPTTGLYSIDLSTGAATLIGNAPVAATLVGATGLAVGDAPGGTITIQNATISVTEGGPAASVVFNRTGGISGPVTITLSVTGGNATNGTDFSTGPFTINIPDGFNSATLNLPITNDALVEGTETAILTITAVNGALIGAQAATTVTITDNDVTPPASPPVSPPPPAFTGATISGGNLVLSGAAGDQVVPVPAGSSVIFADLTGDGAGDVILFTPNLVIVVDGASGRLVALAADLTGDGVRDLAIFNLNGTTTVTDGRTGIVVTV